MTATLIYYINGTTGAAVWEDYAPNTPDNGQGDDNDFLVIHDEANAVQENYKKILGIWSPLPISNIIQSLDPDLQTIADFGHVPGNIIRSNGTDWQSTKLSITDLNDVSISSPTSNQSLIYNGTNWVNQTSAANSLITAQITGLDGQLSGPMIFAIDTTRSNKQLSLETHSLRFLELVVGDNDFLEYGNATAALEELGYIMLYPGTVIAASGMCLDANFTNKEMELWINGTYIQDMFEFPGNGTSINGVTNLNVNFNAGDKIRVRSGTNGNTIDDVMVNVFVKWRNS